MSSWTADELARMGRADELLIAGRRTNGTLRKAVIIWMVTYKNDLYVRSVNGAEAGWFRGTQLTATGHISADGVEKDVAFEAVSDLDDALDVAYRAKYERWPSAAASITSPTARATTLRVDPT